MTLRELKAVIDMAAAEEQLLDRRVYISEVTSSGARLCGPMIVGAYDSNREILTSGSYCTLEWMRTSTVSLDELRAKLYELIEEAPE
jgi:hypothetical protein